MSILSKFYANLMSISCQSAITKSVFVFVCVESRAGNLCASDQPFFFCDFLVLVLVLLQTTHVLWVYNVYISWVV